MKSPSQTTRWTAAPWGAGPEHLGAEEQPDLRSGRSRRSDSPSACWVVSLHLEDETNNNKNRTEATCLRGMWKIFEQQVYRSLESPVRHLDLSFMNIPENETTSSQRCSPSGSQFPQWIPVLPVDPVRGWMRSGMHHRILTATGGGNGSGQAPPGGGNGSGQAPPGGGNGSG
ncbi:hypothetical protein EYF80_041359 [Liparis tanakae]|uniref:Uncharacterized protein n=1 Tax=Liparis tanakae TaxID=230148 RepID=A0A4Z2G6C1_9TELE|nr:hypothetical protein EYF80_041359 [Liparis tanakae]